MQVASLRLRNNSTKPEWPAPEFGGVAVTARDALPHGCGREAVAGVAADPVRPAVAGVLLVLVPGLGPGALRAGSNLLTFMGALYALRGVAVLVSMSGGAFGLGGILLVLFAALADSWMPALVMAAAVLVGLTDTWLDLRARLAAPSGPGK